MKKATLVDLANLVLQINQSNHDRRQGLSIVRIEVQDVLTLKKEHPCGSREWRVVRTGLDIGMRCLGCGRFVMMPRSELERRILEILRGEERMKPVESQIEAS